MIKLNKNKSVESVNVDSFMDINLERTSRIIPINDLDELVNVAEIQIKEQNESTLFRLSATVNPVFTNILTNITGPDSLASFNENRFRDRTSPANASLDLKENITFKQSIDTYLLNKNGWLGYYNPLLLTNDCKLIDLNPKRDKMNLLAAGGVKNWDVCVTYPFTKLVPDIIANGLPIVFKDNIVLNGRNMSRLISAFNHGLKSGDKILISGLSDPSFNGEFFVYRTGLVNGDNKENYFTVDLPHNIFLTPLTTFKRIVNGRESKYYYRVFKKIQTRVNLEMESDDYEIFQMGFANNYFNDSIIQISFNEDIDISNLVDNLNRPLTEFFITFIKKTDDLFSEIKSGFDLEFISEPLYLSNNHISDIRRITNNPATTNIPLETNVNIGSSSFIGDLVEFNDFELIEKVLNDVNHRFNTNNRDVGGSISDGSTNINMGKRYEGYLYKPHHKIQIKELSEYIEQGDNSTENPSYATDLGDGRYLWRDILDFSNSTKLTIPFLNGCHYINRYINLYLKRQDPFGVYGLFYNTFPRDTTGELNEDLGIKTNNDNEC